MAIGLKSNINRIQCKTLRAISDKIIVHAMDFGGQTLDSGIILMDDDKKSSGIKPRWAQVYAKGPKNNDPYEVGDWILIQHGRWTRKIKIENENGDEVEIQKVELEAILAYQNEAPSDLAYFGEEYSDGATATYDPGMFVNN